MGEQREIIDPDLDPRPSCIPFAPRDSAFDDLVVLEGPYANAQGQRFLVTIAAHRDDAAALERYGRELRLWAHAQPGGGAPRAVEDEVLDRELREAVLERDEDDEPEDEHLAFDLRLVEGPGVDRQQGASITLLVDPRIDRGQVRHYSGPDYVIVTVDRDAPFEHSEVLVKGLTGNPDRESAPPGVRRDANGACKVKGVAGRSKFTINGLTGQGKWHQT